MSLLAVLRNPVLISAALAWSIAQVVKLPIEYIRTRHWNWVLLFRAGGMPSSHSALVAAGAHAVGLTQGFASAAYAVSAILAVIVIYDATGIRRQAGLHAEMINAIVQDLVQGHPLREEKLREVLGHSPLEALIGLLLGVVTAQVAVSLWFR